MQSRLRDRYRIERPLSERDGTVTRLAFDEARGRPVVVKSLSLETAGEEELRLFEREAALLEALEHPRVPRYVEHWVDERDDGVSLHLVQDHVAGDTLEALLGRGRRFSEAEIRRIGADIADVLAHLHALRPPLVHRDLKPSNILLDESGAPHLVDFGAATAARPTGHTMVGTFGYMPPEQYEGRALPESDVYSLGATLVFLLTHQHPWESEGGVRGALEQATVSEPVRRALASLLHPVAEERPSALEVAARLRSADGKTTSDRQRGKKGLAAWGAVLGSVGVVGLGVALYAVPAEDTAQTPPSSSSTSTTSVMESLEPVSVGPIRNPTRRGAISKATTCLLTAHSGVLHGRASYLRSVEDPGPTCSEDQLRFMRLYEPKVEAVHRCAEAAAHLEAMGEPHAPFASLSEAGRELLPLFREMWMYYDTEAHRGDGCAKGKEAHPRLVAAWNRWEALLRDASASLDATLSRGVYTDLGDGPRARAFTDFLGALVAVGQAAPAFRGDAWDPKALDDAIEHLARARRAIDEVEPPGEPSPRQAWERLGASCDRALQSVQRRLASFRERQHLFAEGAPTWDPTGVRAAALAGLPWPLFVPEGLF